MNLVNNNQPTKWMTRDFINQFVHSYGCFKEDAKIENYTITKASDKMLGFLADYWKIKVHLSCTEGRKTLSFFIKGASQNASKAEMVREMKLFEKEINFYTIIKSTIDLKGVKPWSARFISANRETIVFEDLNAMGYKSRNKFETFDVAHTQEALRMLARFHACSIIYEQRKRTLLQRPYRINEEFGTLLDKGGYYDTNDWFVQCMDGALAATKSYSKYKSNDKILTVIENRWQKVWSAGLDLSNPLPNSCNVVCHRDLWNNNILFRYKNIDHKPVPDDCLMVDFQAVRCQPPSGDVMLLLYCNLNEKFREDNMDTFLRFYHRELELVLSQYDVKIVDIVPLQSFLRSAEEQRLWALIVVACLVPQMWLDDDLTTDIFCDTEQFKNIMSHEKASFIKRMIENNERYRIKVMQIFEEIVDRYCLH